MKNSIVPSVVCLLLGSVAGYGVRGMMERSDGSDRIVTDAGGVRPASKTSVGGGVTNASAATRPSISSTSGSKGMAEPSLADRMKELLVDYDLKSAKKATANLSANDLQAALALTATMPKSADRDALRAQLYRAWAALNPDAAWKAALADPQDRGRGYLLSAVAGEVAKTNPKAALDLALSLGMGERRSMVMGGVFSEWSKVDVAAAIAFANAHPELPVDYMVSFTTGLSRLAETDPLRAANTAISILDNSRRGYTLTSMMGAWVERDPAAALKWASSLSSSGLQKEAIASVIAAWAKVDPSSALAQAQSIPDADTRSNAVKKGWTDWFRKDPTAATAYLAAPEQAALLQGMGYMYGLMTDGYSPSERAGLLAQIPEGKAREDIMRSMTDTQIRKGQFNQALEMLNAMPDSSSRDRKVVQLGEEWAKTDIKAAEAWLKIQPDSTDRDLAVAGYAGTLARTDPAAALTWTDSIPDAKLRESAMKNIAVRWLKSDAAKAEAWMAGLKEFSESDKKFIRSMASIGGDYLPTMSVTVGTRR